MGAWDAKSFGNDDAMDWCGELQDEGSVADIRAALAAVIPRKPSSLNRLGPGRGDAGGDTGPEEPQGSHAIAAAEVVAARFGQPGTDLPEELAAWISTQAAKISPDLVPLALQALAAIEQKSELQQLWEEIDESTAAEWHAALADLRTRLEKAAR